MKLGSRGRTLLAFLALGAALAVLERGFAAVLPGPEVARETIAISAAEVESLRHDWQRRTGREPDAAELAGLVASEVEERVLFSEGLRLEIDRTDAVVRERLVRNLRFAVVGPERSDAELWAEARALGMHRSDLVVRRRLVQRVRRALERAGRSPDELRARYVVEVAALESGG